MRLSAPDRQVDGGLAEASALAQPGDVDTFDEATPASRGGRSPAQPRLMFLLDTNVISAPQAADKANRTVVAWADAIPAEASSWPGDLDAEITGSLGGRSWSR